MRYFNGSTGCFYPSAAAETNNFRGARKAAKCRSNTIQATIGGSTPSLMPVTKRSAQMAPRGKFENRANASGDSQTASFARQTRTHAGAQASSTSLSLFKSSRHHQCAARLDRQRNDGSRDARRELVPSTYQFRRRHRLSRPDQIEWVQTAR